MNRSYVMKEELAASVPAPARSILDHYAMADTLALYFQQRRRRVLISLFSVAVAAVFFFEIYAHLLPLPMVLALYPLSLAVGYLVYWFARKRDYHNKHLDYRALAEGLRVQLFWKLAGVTDEVSDHYLRKQRTELEWVREALRTQLRTADWGRGGAGASASSQALLVAIDRLVLPRWVEDQRTFFENAAQRDRHKIELRELWAVWLLVAGLVAGAVVVAGQLSASNSTSSNWQHVLIVLMGFAPAIAAAIGGYADKMVFASQAKRYLWMAELFARAEARLRKAVSAGNVVAAQVLIAELGNEALGENGDWVLMHRERPPEAPKGA